MKYALILLALILSACNGDPNSRISGAPTAKTGSVVANSAHKKALSKTLQNKPSGLSKKDRGAIDVHNLTLELECITNITDANIILLGGKSKTWEEVAASADKSISESRDDFVAIYQAVKSYPELQSAIKNRRNIFRACGHDAILSIAAGDVSADRLKNSLMGELHEADARIDTELELIPMSKKDVIPELKP